MRLSFLFLMAIAILMTPFVNAHPVQEKMFYGVRYYKTQFLRTDDCDAVLSDGNQHILWSFVNDGFDYTSISHNPTSMRKFIRCVRYLATKQNMALKYTFAARTLNVMSHITFTYNYTSNPEEALAALDINPMLQRFYPQAIS